MQKSNAKFDILRKSFLLKNDQQKMWHIGEIIISKSNKLIFFKLQIGFYENVFLTKNTIVL